MSYCISTDEEAFSGRFENRESALSEAINAECVEAGQTLWIGQVAERKAADYLDIELLIEEIAEAAYEEVGCAQEDWPELSIEEKEQLAELVCNFLDAHSPIGFFAVDQVEKISVTPELVKQYYRPRRCRVCGCTDDDCRQCIEKTGVPCHWVEPDLCSACAEEGK